ncbi:MAG: aromatic ring-hydroxylating dioxygenase subunit alpha [Candidatus Dadabacteria bacterium]|nr:MAG: aromatic ring-hydroxylating dioxygenase subunit alpha [Candidatus Dadabacteria bacterium]
MPSPRWPFTHNPKGWFMISYSEDLEPGDVIPLHVFEQDLVLYRTESGRPVLLDAFCPHLGAHLGHGGKVEGEELRCPFHAWKFNCDGQCSEIPYTEKIPPKAKIRPWEIVERNGMIFAWNDEEGSAPEWEIPEFEEASDTEAWTEFERRRWQIRTHNIEMAENAVDSAHFKYLHGTRNMPQSQAEVNGHILRVFSDAGMTTPQGNVDGSIESMSYGFGLSVVRFSGIVDTFLLSTMTPTDSETIDVRFNFKVKRLAGADITRGVGKAFINEITRQLEQDRPIWENKRWVKPPILAEGDGPIGVYRKWCKQFFPEGTFDKLEMRVHA